MSELAELCSDTCQHQKWRSKLNRKDLATISHLRTLHISLISQLNRIGATAEKSCCVTIRMRQQNITCLTVLNWNTEKKNYFTHNHIYLTYSTTSFGNWQIHAPPTTCHWAEGQKPRGCWLDNNNNITTTSLTTINFVLIIFSRQPKGCMSQLMRIYVVTPRDSPNIPSVQVSYMCNVPEAYDE